MNEYSSTFYLQLQNISFLIYSWFRIEFRLNLTIYVMHVYCHTDEGYEILSIVAILFYTESVTLGLISSDDNTLES